MNNLIENLKKTTAREAKKYMLSDGFYPEESILPPFFKSTLNNLSLKPIDWRKVERKSDTIPIDEDPTVFYTRMSDGHILQKYEIIHPWHYCQIVNEFTKKEHWRELKKIFTKKRFVDSYTTPAFSGKRTKNAIKYWKRMEDDIIMDAIEYSFLGCLDVKGCYPSIYTHSISWALHGKKFIKKGYNNKKKHNKYDLSLFGNKLDKLCQQANKGQTKGIPVGPMVFDIIAEIILLGVDDLIDKYLQKSKIDCKIKRFKDDYRIICKSKDDFNKILRIITNALDEYGLHLNSSKTEMHNIVTQSIIRPWVKDVERIVSMVRWSEIRNNNSKKRIKNFDEIMSALIDIQIKYPSKNVLMIFVSRIDLEDYFLSRKFNENETKKILAQILTFGRINKTCLADVIRILAKFCDTNNKYLKKKGNKARVMNAILYDAFDEVDLHGAIWGIYLFRYFDIRKKLKKKILKNIDVIFKNDSGYKLIKPLITNLKNDGIIFSDTRDYNGKNHKSYIADTNIVKQAQDKILKEIKSFRYTPNK